MATSTQVRRVLLQMSADEGDTETKIDAIRAKADELGKLHPELAVKINSAAASASLRVIREDLAATAAAAGATPIIPKVDDSLADVKLIGLRSDLEALEARAEQAILLKVDDADARAKVMTLRARLAELGEKVEKPEISVAGVARAEADIAAISAALDKLGRKKVEPKVVPKLDPAAALKAGTAAGESTAGGMASGISGSSYLIIGAVAAALAALPAVAASGGAVIGAALGAKLLIGTKAVQGPLYKQFTGMMSTLTSVMRVAALPLLGPLRQAFTQIGAFARQVGPLLSRAFGAIGPLVKPMTQGLEAFVSGVLPGFVTLMRAAAPAVRALASLLGSTGAGLGGLFRGLAPAIGPSSVLLTQVGRIIGLIAPRIGLLSGVLARVFGPALKLVADLMQRLTPASNALIGPFTKVATILAGALTGAITKIAGPLTQMITLLADKLGPILPQVAGALAKVAGVAAGQMADSLVKLMPSVQRLTGHLMTLMEKVVIPLLPTILQLSGTFGTLGNMMIPLLPPTIMLADKLLELGLKVIIPLMPVIQRLAGYLVDLANAAVKAMSLVSDVLSLFGLGGGGAVQGLGGWTDPAALSMPSPADMSMAGGDAGVTAGSAYGSAWAAGATSAAPKAAKKAKPKPVTAADFALILAGGVGADLTGTAAQVRAGIGKLIQVITQDERAGVISKGEGSDLTLWLDKDSTKLQALANKRRTILAEIAAAQKYAAGVTKNILQQDDLQSAAAGGWNGGPQTTHQIITNLRMDVANIRKFARNIAKLRKMGLNRDYLNELIQMGPDAGGQLAQQLADSGLTDIRQINQAESAISKASVSLGRTAADAMYDSGKMAGKGFLSGLEAQQAALEKLMEKIAESMIKTLKQKLEIHSPSGVGRAIGANFGGSVGLGIDDSHGQVITASSRLSKAMLPQAHGGTGAGRPGATVIEFRFAGNVPAEVRRWLKKSIRVNGGDPAVIGA